MPESLCIRNEGSSVFEPQDYPLVRLGAFAELRSVLAAGEISVDHYSTVNRASVGRYFAVACHSYVGRCTSGNYVEIGSRCSIGGFEHPLEWMSTGSFQFRRSQDLWPGQRAGTDVDLQFESPWVEMGHDIWVGDNAVVVGGVSIGTGAVIGAGAVVTRDVEPYAIVVGSPARVIRHRFDEETRRRLLELEWWTFSVSDLSGVDFSNISRALEAVARLRDIVNSAG